MATSSVSLGSNLYQTSPQSTAGQERQSFKQLANALQSGDLSGAQQAFTTLQKLLSTNQSGSQNSQPSNNQTNPIQTDFANLGQALSSGDLTTAQSDFSKLQSDLKVAAQSGASGSGQGVQSAHHGGHHHHHASGASDSDTTESDSSTTSTTGNTINVYA